MTDGGGGGDGGLVGIGNREEGREKGRLITERSARLDIKRETSEMEQEGPFPFTQYAL